MREPTNPFLVSGYHSPAYFCNRESELAWLIEQFDNERNAVIHSWRRVGKTSLLRHYFHHMATARKADCIYVDLLGTTSMADAQRRISEALLHQWIAPGKSMGNRVMSLLASIGATVGFDSLSGTPQLTFSVNQSSSVPAALHAMGKFLLDNKKPVTICLDEFQHIISYKENAEALFRAWAQQFPMVRFVYSGSHRKMMVSMFSEQARPFYRSAQILALDPLDHVAYQTFITRLFKQGKRQIDKATIEKIFSWTRMQTYYVQLVCNKLYGKNTAVTAAQLNEAFSEIILQEVPVFSSYQLLMTSFQWKLLVAIAKEEAVQNPMSKDFINRNALGAASSVSAALRMLESKEFLIVQNKQYTMHDTLLMRWLQQL